MKVCGEYGTDRVEVRGLNANLALTRGSKLRASIDT
jgi:hypothetical protein